MGMAEIGVLQPNPTGFMALKHSAVSFHSSVIFPTGRRKTVRTVVLHGKKITTDVFTGLGSN